MYREELTYELKVALEAEVAAILNTASNNGDLLKLIYTMLKETPEKHKEHVMQCMRELTNISDKEFNDILRAIELREVPLWIWIKKCILDIKGLTKVSAQEGVLDIKADRTLLRKKVVESAFIMFCRRVSSISKYSLVQLCNEILQDLDLRFLTTACYDVLATLKQPVIGTELDIPESILDIEIELRNRLNFGVEYKNLEGDEEPKKDEGNEEKKVVVLTEEAMKQFPILSKVIMGMVEETNARIQEKQEENSKYTVVKVYKSSGIQSALKSFKTREEAIEYVKKLNQEFPELKDTCNFHIEHNV